jgi:hypothetical protein
MSCRLGQYIFKVTEKEKTILVISSIFIEYHKKYSVISLIIILYTTKL